MAFNWTCPHCVTVQSVTAEKRDEFTSIARVGDIAGGPVGVDCLYIGCANPDCEKITIIVSVLPVTKDSRGLSKIDYTNGPIIARRIMPEGAAKPQPDYVPSALVSDYTEACLILALSPKASATLTRRWLQGMIRDFADVRGSTLYHEIDQLRQAVESGTAPQGVTDETVEAIDHVRKMGNIGAHMERDINHILDVDPEEAKAMIELVEMLFDEWYVARHRRRSRLSKIADIASNKEEAKIALNVQ